MEIFYTKDIGAGYARLDAEESGHCVRVLRHRAGDEICVIDGEGTFYRCRLVSDDPKAAEAQIVEVMPDWGAHPYALTMAVCPTKNPDRYEWFAEKGTELGLDCIAPVLGDHSERRVFKTERLRKILLSASKQSLKGAIPTIAEPRTVREFIAGCTADIKLIAYCFEDPSIPRISIKRALAEASIKTAAVAGGQVAGAESAGAVEAGSEKSAGLPSIAILIGPEGDFSRDEAAAALQAGFVPVHLGESRLRTETAALTAVAAVYFNFME